MDPGMMRRLWSLLEWAIVLAIILLAAHLLEVRR